MKQTFKNNVEKEKGITLIVLVITIIVLLILAGVSIATLTGESGILTQAQNAKKETITGQEKEQVEVAYVSATANKLGYNVTADELQANLEKNVGKNKTETAECENGLIVKFMDTTNFYVVENETGKVEKTVAQLINKKIEVTSSEQSIIFSNTITQKDVDAISGKRNTNFEIIGIGTSKDKSAEFLKSATGKSGNIEIQGENSSATFKYTLTNFMQGDEEFFVKCKIGEEEYIQALNVIQGDEVIYEEDFAGIIYTGNWKDNADGTKTATETRYYV